MKPVGPLFGLIVICVSIAACQSQPPRNRAAEDIALASANHSLSAAARQAALSKVGVQVCKRIGIGISEYGWIRGRVNAIGRDVIQVRIASSGQFPLMLNGVQLKEGILVWDEMSDWTPCSY